MKTNNNNRFEYLDYLRGLAAFFVAFGHLTWPLSAHDGLVVAVGKSAADQIFLAPEKIFPFFLYLPSAFFFVSCFFLLSGFVIQMSLERYNPGKFIIQRIFRIYPVFIISIFIFLLANKYIFSKPNPDVGIILKNIFLIHGTEISPVAWTLLVEIKFYFFCFLLHIFKTSLKTRVVITNLIMLVIIILDHNKSTSIPYNARNILYGSFTFFCWMNIGSLIYEINKVIGNQDTRKTLVNNTAIFFFSLVAFYAFFVLAPITETGINHSKPELAGPYAASLFAFILFVFFERLFTFRSKTLKFMADISYPLYCVHIAIGWVVFKLVFNYVGWKFGVVFSVGSSIMLAYIIHITIEKTFNKLGKKIGDWL